jgi:hypothetical protein
VPQLLLHPANVGAPLKQMRGKRVPKRVAACRLVDARRQHRPAHRLLHGAFIDVVPASCAAARIGADPIGPNTYCPQRTATTSMKG